MAGFGRGGGKRQDVMVLGEENKLTPPKFVSANEVQVAIDYQAILAQDFPNGMKTGDILALKGQSIFTFLDNKIIPIRDIA
ncbi:MAG: hypothetical protein HC880_12355 [Bacteroidia bacterium]|nr:hypothetical protein [Bacteroidia bacterium]